MKTERWRGIVRLASWMVLPMLWGVAPSGCESHQAKEWKQGCDQGNLSDCVNWGVALARESQEPSTLAQGASLYARACQGGDRVGCRMLGKAYAHGLGVDKDIPKGQGFLTAACQAKDGLACEAGCDLGDAVLCLNVAAVASMGGHDLHRAAGYFHRACELGHPVGCDELAMLLQGGSYPEVPTSVELARKKSATLRKTACAASNPPSFCEL